MSTRTTTPLLARALTAVTTLVCRPPWGHGRQLEPCGATDGLRLRDDPLCADEPFGRCNLEAGHQTGGWHQEWRGDQLWAEWRGPAPGERCGICGKDGAEH